MNKEAVPNAWDNSGEPVEFDHDGGEYRAYGAVSSDGDARVTQIEVLLDLLEDGELWQMIEREEPKAAAREALERAWWEQLEWRDQERIKNREG